MSRSDIMTEAQEKLSEMKAELTKLEMEKKQLVEKMGEYKQ